MTGPSLFLERHRRLLTHFLPSFCLSRSENTGRREQLWPGLHPGRAHPHAHRRAFPPSPQPGGVPQFLLHLTWTAGGLRDSWVMVPALNPPWCLLTARNDRQLEAVTFPNHVRGSACREVSRLTAHEPRTPKHCYDSRNTGPEEL